MSEARYFVDLELSRRLERVEAETNREFVEARAQFSPASGAKWIEVAGAYAMFDGVQSPLTQTFCLGIFEKITDDELEKIETFYRDLSTPVFHEVSPLADATLLPLLTKRGYYPIELTSVMFLPLKDLDKKISSNSEKVSVRIIEPYEEELWARTAAKGWSESTEVSDLMFELALISAKRNTSKAFLAEIDDQAVATGALSIYNGVAMLAGASTIPEARKQGAQSALLNSRLNYALDQGCDIAVMGASPGSASQRNAERQGFRIAYTRIKWQLKIA